MKGLALQKAQLCGAVVSLLLLTTGACSRQTPVVPEVEANYLAVQYIGDIYPVAYSDGWSVFADWSVYASSLALAPLKQER